MTISNTFHCSTRNHSIRNSSDLGKVQAHDSRSYQYTKNPKINDLIGNSDTISQDVQNLINMLLQQCIDEYNERQKRKDRWIKENAFQYFEKNKKLDVATEIILQIGDKDFWSKFRIDTECGTNKRGKKIIKHDFNDDAIKVMNETYYEQALAFENIYVTDKEKIYNKILNAFEIADTFLWEFEKNYSIELKTEFDELMKIKKKSERLDFIANKGYSDDEIQLYHEYADKMQEWKNIVDSRLLERIKHDQMHIKNVCLVQHNDEYSLHAHNVAICYCDGYLSGLSSRVSKSIVLNKWTLEVLQEKMHEIAEKHMNKHPEIFESVSLKEKHVGRNFDYSKNEITRIKIQEKQKQYDELTIELQLTEHKMNLVQSELDNKIDELKLADEKNNILLAQNQSLQQQQMEMLNELRTLRSFLLELKGEYIRFKDNLIQLLESIQPIEYIESIMHALSDFAARFREKIEEIYDNYVLTEKQEIDLENLYNFTEEHMINTDNLISTARNLKRDSENSIIDLDEYISRTEKFESIDR